MDDSKRPHGEVAQEKREVNDETRASEGAPVYDFSQENEEIQNQAKGGSLARGGKREAAKSLASTQVAATSEEGGDLQARYFEKYVDQRMASIDEKILSIKVELQDRTDAIQRSIERSLAEMREQEKQRQIEMRERDNQRHAEIMASNARLESREARVDARFEDLINKLDARDARIDARFDDLNKKFDARDARIDAKLDGFNNKLDSTNKWIIGFIIAALISLAGIVISNFWAIINLTK